jgi:predicted DNA-binding transcriptional regulator YafY
MAAGKNPYVRYQVINACFTNKQKRYWTKAELIQHLEQYDFIVSARTLDFDLEMMRHDERLKFFAPIAFSRKERAYYYTDPAYSINTLQLSDEHLRAFSSIVDLLQQFRGSKMVQEFEGALDKIVRGVDVLRRQKLRSAPVIHAEKAPYYKGLEYLDVVMRAIDERQCLRIAYQKFTKQKPEDHVFHPYLLKEYKGRWYVLGHSEARQQVITLALDRMEKIQPEPVPYKPNTKLNANEFFKHTLGITHAQGPVEEVVLWFSPALGPYIKTQHLHASQQIVKDDKDGLVIRLKLIINYELTSLLLSFCPEVCVLQPLALKEKLDGLLVEGRKVNERKG